MCKSVLCVSRHGRQSICQRTAKVRAVQVEEQCNYLAWPRSISIRVTNKTKSPPTGHAPTNSHQRTAGAPTRAHRRRRRRRRLVSLSIPFRPSTFLRNAPTSYVQARPRTTGPGPGAGAPEQPDGMEKLNVPAAYVRAYLRPNLAHPPRYSDGMDGLIMRATLACKRSAADEILHCPALHLPFRTPRLGGHGAPAPPGPRGKKRPSPQRRPSLAKAMQSLMVSD